MREGRLVLLGSCPTFIIIGLSSCPFILGPWSSIMVEIVALTGFVTVAVLFLSFRHHHAREDFQPKWWYGVAAICIVCHLALAFLIHKEFPILATVLVVCACGLSYITCKIAILEDKIQKR